jgi:hypothetical protein
MKIESNENASEQVRELVTEANNLHLRLGSQIETFRPLTIVYPVGEGYLQSLGTEEKLADLQQYIESLKILFGFLKEAKKQGLLDDLVNKDGASGFIQFLPLSARGGRVESERSAMFEVGLKEKTVKELLIDFAKVRADFEESEGIVRPITRITTTIRKGAADTGVDMGAREKAEELLLVTSNDELDELLMKHYRARDLDKIIDNLNEKLLHKEGCDRVLLSALAFKFGNDSADMDGEALQMMEEIADRLDDDNFWTLVRIVFRDAVGRNENDYWVNKVWERGMSSNQKKFFMSLTAKLQGMILKRLKKAENSMDISREIATLCEFYRDSKLRTSEEIQEYEGVLTECSDITKEKHGELPRGFRGEFFVDSQRLMEGVSYLSLAYADQAFTPEEGNIEAFGKLIDLADNLQSLADKLGDRDEWGKTPNTLYAEFVNSLRWNWFPNVFEDQDKLFDFLAKGERLKNNSQEFRNHFDWILEKRNKRER